MNSPFANLFLAIMAHIKDAVPEIQHVDHDLGQLEGNSIRPAVAFPCVLVDFQGFIASNLATASQAVEGDIIVKLGFAQYSDSSDMNEPLWREFALGYYDIEYKVNKALHNWSPSDEFGYLTRTNMDSENKPQAIRVRTLKYRLEFEDHSAKPTQRTVPVPPASITN